MKMHFKYIAFILSAYISYINCAVHFERIYGVADEDLGKYQRTPDNLFHCLDGNGVIPYSSLNDDYCDCADGSDEPGTPACQNSKFYCENRGSKGHFIPSSRVNDGVCDYDLCCDGSDEYNGFIVCPDKCEEMAKLQEMKKKEELAIYFMAFPYYQKMLLAGISGITVDIKTKSEKKILYDEENEKFTELKEKIKSLEKIEKETKDYYKSLYRELRAEYKNNKLRLKKVIEDILKIKNNSNMDQVELNSIFDEYNEELLKEFEKPKIQNEENSNNNNEENKNENADKSSEESKNEEEIIDEDEEEEKRLVAEKSSAYNKLRSELTDLRVKRNDLDRKAKSIKKEIDELDKKINTDSGKNFIFYTLYGETFTLNTTDYIYTFIWGKEIKQKQKKGGSLTSLGKFKEFRNDYKSIFYDEGAQCWNGPKRSVHINLTCAFENQIIKIDEPSKCEYVMEFSTPALCDFKDLDLSEENKNSLKEEEEENKDNPEFSEEMIESIKAMLNESPTQSILDEDDVLGGKDNSGEKKQQENEQKHDEL